MSTTDESVLIQESPIDDDIIDFNETNNDFEPEILLTNDEYLEKLTNVGSGNVLVPKWAVGLAIITGAFLATVCAAAVAIVGTAPRPGFYSESCQKRSCLPNSGLKCINGICQCLDNYYYSTKCMTKKDYNQTCSRTTPCKDNTNLTCSSGRCLCNSTQIWNGSYCVQRNSYKGKCNKTDNCLVDLMLYCDNKTKTCLCSSVRYWDDTVCTLRLTLNETCTNTTQCTESKQLLCLNGTCTCSSTQYWETLTSECLNKVKEKSTCTSNYQCYQPMNCTNGICKCGINQYYDMDSSQCLDLGSLNDSCTSTSRCRIDKGLECRGGICQCISTKPFWTNYSSQCIKPYTYTQDCNVTYECDQSLNLFCNNASTSCNCPTSIGSGKCDCQRVAGDEWYWNGASCVQAAAYGQSCMASANYSCQTLTQNTFCNSSNFCDCDPNGGLKNSTNSCVSCYKDWVYINEYCYRLGTIPGDSDSDGTSTSIDNSCQKSLLPSSNMQSTVRLAELKDPLVRAYFKTYGSPTQLYYVDLSIDTCSGNLCYESDDENWKIYATSSQWCSPITNKTCAYYNVAYDCFTDYCCTVSSCSTPAIVPNHACQYIAT